MVSCKEYNTYKHEPSTYHRNIKHHSADCQWSVPPTPSPGPISKTSWNIKPEESCTPSSLSPIPHCSCQKWYTKTYKTNNGIILRTRSDDALPKRTYQELLEAFRQRHCISVDLTNVTKVDNGFTELIDYAITKHYPTLEYLSKLVAQPL